LVALLVIAACNAGSDAQNIIEADNAKLRATISHYEAMQPTMTAQTEQLQATVTFMANEINRISEQNRALTSQLNANASARLTSNPAATQPPADVANPAAEGAPVPTAEVVSAVNAPITSPTGVTIERVALARGRDGNGCALDESATFATSDEFVYVVATVSNFKSGTVFRSIWTGPRLDNTYDWTATYAAQQECIHFFIKPGELALEPGDYTVVFAAADVQSPSLRFTIQAGQ
jgi:uncharacterized coiled-coil protein SlyX